VVDDDLQLLRLNVMVLQQSGYHVDSAGNGETGWQVLHAAARGPGGYDLLITDHDMPGLNGLDLVRKVRSARMALPVIMASARPPTEDFTRHPWLQPTATLLKPYTLAALLGVVNEALQAKGTEARSRATPPGEPDGNAKEDLLQ
jgi:DNA-binding response OmpR family regulator